MFAYQVSPDLEAGNAQYCRGCGLWRNRHAHPLLVGVEINTALLENNLAMSIKSPGMLTSFDPAPSLQGGLAQGI